jgi:hypothetical protein
VNAIDVKLSLAWRQCVALIGLIRLVPAQIPGGARRIEVSEKIVALDKTKPEGLDHVATMEWRCELVLNREHLGSLKIGLLGLWSSKDGATQEQIVDVAKGLRLWVKHIEPIVIKEEIEAIAELDGEADIGDLDEVPTTSPKLGKKR